MNRHLKTRVGAQRSFRPAHALRFTRLVLAVLAPPAASALVSTLQDGSPSALAYTPPPGLTLCNAYASDYVAGKRFPFTVTTYSDGGTNTKDTYFVTAGAPPVGACLYLGSQYRGHTIQIQALSVDY